jgi:predicted ATPase
LSQGIKYRFIHDKIQQAAHELIPEEKQQQFHLKIGRLLLKGKVIEENNEEIFDILNHFNSAISDITEVDERLKLAKFNLWAGKRSRLASAYQGEKSFINAGLLLMDGLDVNENSELQFSLQKELATCQYLTGENELAEENFKLLLKASKPSTVIEVASLYCEMLATMNRHRDALSLAFRTLATFNIKIPEYPSKLRVLWEIAKIRLIIGRRNIAEIDLPLMQSIQYQQISALITQLGPIAYTTNANLSFLLICISVKLSLQYGFTISTGSSLIPYAFMTMHRFNWYHHALQICTLYEKLTMQYSQGAYYEPRNKYMILCFIDIWRFPLGTTLDQLQQLSPYLLDVGDFVFCNYSKSTILRFSMALGRPASESQVYLQNTLSLIKKYEIKFFIVLAEFCNYLLSCYIKEDFSVAKVKKFEEKVLATKNNTEIGSMYAQAVKVCFLFGYYDEANYYAKQFDIYIPVAFHI